MSLRPFLFGLLLWACPGMAQEDTVWVSYAPGMDLRDGIYANMQAFRSNRPTVQLEDLRDQQGRPVVDIRSALGRLTYQPDTGVRQAIDPQRIWGFCQNDVVYVRAGDGFYRIGLMGGLSHLVYEQSYRDWDPFMYGYGTTTRTILQQQLINVSAGTMQPFDAAGMEQALAGDPVLLEEFMSFSKKQRNSPELLFRFLRSYNEIHPLRFPK